LALGPFPRSPFTKPVSHFRLSSFFYRLDTANQYGFPCCVLNQNLKKYFPFLDIAVPILFSPPLLLLVSGTGDTFPDEEPMWFRVVRFKKNSWNPSFVEPVPSIFSGIARLCPPPAVGDISPDNEYCFHKRAGSPRPPWFFQLVSTPTFKV